MMGLFGRKQILEPVQPSRREPDTVTLYGSDDLLKRAENIVWLCGFRGALVAGRVLEVFRILQTYERLDKEDADAKKNAKKP